MPATRPGGEDGVVSPSPTKPAPALACLRSLLACILGQIKQRRGFHPDEIPRRTDSRTSTVDLHLWFLPPQTLPPMADTNAQSTRAPLKGQSHHLADWSGVTDDETTKRLSGTANGARGQISLWYRGLPSEGSSNGSMRRCWGPGGDRSGKGKRKAINNTESLPSHLTWARRGARGEGGWYTFGSTSLRGRMNMATAAI
ncbi:hypothetical protein BDN71DRAFT_1434650 [Pleurotus eryngii]|uniref:Uncharacterized protein n=1 Tax=Pleurotus eryngii TaxID=5323 RepID=A0A9P5ZN85_PLEER|nr:hypothetical protein BDN71DRAFT_1434650 [Pleurotus eryngii]